MPLCVDVTSGISWPEIDANFGHSNLLIFFESVNFYQSARSG